MMLKIYVPLNEGERIAVCALAQRERRSPRDQAALMIRGELERMGLLKPAPEFAETNNEWSKNANR